MASNLEKVFEQVKNLNYDINEILRQSTYYDYDDLSGLDINYKDADQLLLLNELQCIINNLGEVKEKIDYLNKPIKYVGTLYKADNGKYETIKGDVLCCGRTIEAFVYDEGYEVDSWVKTRIEHNGKDYYLVGLVGYEKTPLEGLKVRIR